MCTLPHISVGSGQFLDLCQFHKLYSGGISQTLISPKKLSKIGIDHSINGSTTEGIQLSEQNNDKSLLFEAF